jgi:hypothetical protein
VWHDIFLSVKPVIPCPHCWTALPAADVLDAATVSVPDFGLVHLSCPRCGAAAWAQVMNGHLALGTPAEHADLFRPSTSAPAPALAVRAQPAWLDCWFEGRYRRFPAAR